ncbi:MAG: hypothetical protein QXT72_04290 [Candidatus Micrarchaeia archaeon]
MRGESEVSTSEVANRLYELVTETDRNDDILQIITNALANFDDEYIANTIQYVNKKNPRNYAAYLNSALKNHYIDTNVNGNSQNSVNNSDKQQIDSSNVTINDLKYRIRELKREKYNITVRSSWIVERNLIDDFDSMPLDKKMEIIDRALYMLAQLNNVSISISEFNDCSNLGQIREKLRGKMDIITENMFETYLSNVLHELFPDRVDEIRRRIADQLSKIDSEIGDLESKLKLLL